MDRSEVEKISKALADTTRLRIFEAISAGKYEEGITELCSMAGIEPSQLDQVFHGTTIATNIVIEHNGATVGMMPSCWRSRIARAAL